MMLITKVNQTVFAISTHWNLQGYNDVVTTDDAKIKYHIICLWWLSSSVATKDGLQGLLEWLGCWQFQYRQWGGHVLLVNVYTLIEFMHCFYHLIL